ncbi:hypothetical protein BGW42_000432 [Actinomortierella wolfii]|nr:hypothetical protein BGW42_000432 [Actinomortierella wolfii]
MSLHPAHNTALAVSPAGLPILPASQLVTPMGLDPQDVPWLINLIAQGAVSLLDRRLLINMNTNVAVGPSYMLHTFQFRDLVVAIKQYHQPKDVIHELHQLLVTPPNPFILKLHGIVQLGERGLTCLATEYHPIGNLRQYIAGYRSQLSALHQMQIIHDIISGLECLHQRGTLHMNLHSANVLISHEGIALLTDFGKPNLRAEVGMPPKPTVEQERVRSLAAVFMAPEVLASNSFSNLSEVYALGMIMYELLTGKIAFEQDLGSPTLVSRIMFGRQETIPPNIPGSPGPAYEALIKECWTLAPEKRPHLSIVKVRLEELMEQIRAQQKVVSSDLVTQQFSQHDVQPQQSSGPLTTQQQQQPQAQLQQEQQQSPPSTYTSLQSQPTSNVYTKVIVTNNTNKIVKSIPSASKDHDSTEDRTPLESWTIGFTPATVAKDRDALPLGATPPANQTLPAGTASSHVVSYVVAPATAAPFDSMPLSPIISEQTMSPTFGPTPSRGRQHSEPNTSQDGIYPSTASKMSNQSIPQAVTPKNEILANQQNVQSPTQLSQQQKQEQKQQTQQEQQQQHTPILKQKTPPASLKATGRKASYPLPPGHIAPRTSSMPPSPKPRAQPPSSQESTASSTGTSMSATTPSQSTLSVPMSPVSPIGLGETGTSSNSGGEAALAATSSMDAFFQKWSTISSMPDVRSESIGDMQSKPMSDSLVSSETALTTPSKRESLPSPTVYEVILVSSYLQSEPLTASTAPESTITDQLQQMAITSAPFEASSKVTALQEGSVTVPTLTEKPLSVTTVATALMAQKPITEVSPIPASSPEPVAAPTPVTASTPAAVSSTPQTAASSSTPTSPLSPVPVPIDGEKSEWRMGRESVLILPVFPTPPATLHNRRLSSLESLVPRHRSPGASKLSSHTTMGSTGSMSSMSTEESSSRQSLMGLGRTAGNPQNSNGLTNGGHLAFDHLTRETYHHITSADDVPMASRSTDIFSAARNGDLEELKLFLDLALQRVDPQADPLVAAEAILDEFEPTERLPVLCCAAVARKNKYQALNMVLRAGANVESREMRMGNTPLHLVCETAIPPTSSYQSPIRYKQDEHGSLIEPAWAGDSEEPLQMLQTTDDDVAELNDSSMISLSAYLTNPEDEFEDADELNAKEKEALARVQEDSEAVSSLGTNRGVQCDAETPSPTHRKHGSSDGSGDDAFYTMGNQMLVKGGLEDQIRLLLLAGAPIDATNLRDETPLLMLLRHSDNVSSLATLLRLGADPTIVAPFGPGTMNQPDGGSTANVVAPKKLMRRNKTSKTSRFAKARGTIAAKATGERASGSGNGISGSSRPSSRLLSPNMVVDHTLVLHGSALSHAAYYLRLQCVKYLLQHEVECSEPANIERAIQACRLSATVEANPSMIGLQTQILHLLEHEWSGEAGQMRRRKVAERVLARKTKPARSRVSMVAMLVAAGEKTSEMAPMSPTLMTVSTPLSPLAFPLPKSTYSNSASAIIRPKSAHISTSSPTGMTADASAKEARYASSPITTGMTSPTSSGAMPFSSLPPTPTSPVPPIPTPDILARLQMKDRGMGSPTITTGSTGAISVSPRVSIGSTTSVMSSSTHSTSGGRSGNRTSTYAFTGYDATADPDFKLADSKNLFRKLRKPSK